MTANNKLLLCTLFIFFIVINCIPRAKAAEEIIATVMTDVSNDYYHLVVDVDDNGQFLKAFLIDNFVEGKSVTRDVLPMSTFIKDGMNVQNGPYIFARVVPQNFDKDQGGGIIIDAIFNILTGKRKSFEFYLAKDKSGWKLFSNGNAITQIFAHANRLPVIGVVGARDLTMK